jgi:hypothetical protein
MPKYYSSSQPRNSISSAFAEYLRSSSSSTPSPSVNFDHRWYCGQNPDWSNGFEHPFLHFWRYGISNGRDPDGNLVSMIQRAPSADMTNLSIAREIVSKQSGYHGNGIEATFMCKSLDLINRSMSDFSIHLTASIIGEGGIDLVKDASFARADEAGAASLTGRSARQTRRQEMNGRLRFPAIAPEISNPNFYT